MTRNLLLINESSWFITQKGYFLALNKAEEEMGLSVDDKLNGKKIHINRILLVAKDFR